MAPTSPTTVTATEFEMPMPFEKGPIPKHLLTDRSRFFGKRVGTGFGKPKRYRKRALALG